MRGDGEKRAYAEFVALDKAKKTSLDSN